MLSRKKQLVVSVEATKGTAETITSADSAIFSEDIDYQVNAAPLERNPLKSSISREASIPGAEIATVTCRMELKGSGTAGDPTAWGTLLKGCGFAETDGASDVIYNLKSADGDSDTLTMAVYHDGKRYLCYGARGNVSFEMNANQVAYANFTFTGIHSAVTDAAMLTGLTYDTELPEKFVNAQTSFNFGSAWADGVFSAFSFDLNNTVALREDANATNGLSYAIITDRDPAGSIDLDDVLVATQALHSHLLTPTTGSLTLTLGQTAGNILTLTAPTLQITNIGGGDDNGVSKLNCDFNLRTGSSGDDELVITLT